MGTTQLRWVSGFSSFDALAVKYDAATGSRVWQSYYEGPSWKHDFGSALDLSPDGNRVFMAGATLERTGSLPADILTLALDAATGSILWVSMYNESSSEGASDVEVSPDGSLVYVSGYTGSTGIVIAYDATTGQEVWVTKQSNFAYSLNDGNPAQLAVNPFGSLVYILRSGLGVVALNATSGAKVWESEFGTSLPLGVSAGGRGLAVDPNGWQVFAAGYVRDSVTRDRDLTVVAYDAIGGNRTWAANYTQITRTATQQSIDEALAVAADPFGRYVIASGFSAPAATGSSIYTSAAHATTVAFHANTGERAWAHQDDATLLTSGLPLAHYVKAAPNGCVYVGASVYPQGESGRNARTIAYNPVTGVRLWASEYGRSSGSEDNLFGLAAGAGTPRVFSMVRAESLSGNFTIVSYAGSGEAVCSGDDPQSPPESIRGTTPFSGGTLKDIFPCPNRPTHEEEGSVNVGSGEFMATQCLLGILGRGLDLDLEMTYRSQAGATAGPFGYGWDHSYNKRLEVQPGGDVARYIGHGRRDVYAFTPASGYVSPPGFYDTLTKRPDGTFFIRDRHGTVENFTSVGRLSEIVDRNNNTLRFQYDASSRLTSIVDSLDRQVNITYDLAGRIINVTDFGGRRFSFGYDGNGDLANITTPGDADHPEGLKTSYAYDATHKLLRVTDPKHQTYLVNRYDSLSRVARQQYGLDAFTFTYQDNPGVTTVTDRNGNVVRWTMSPSGPVPLRKEVLTNRDVRGGEPDMYVTLYAHDADTERTRIVYANGDVVEQVFDTQNPDRLQRGNLLEQRHIPAPVLGSSAAPIVTRYTYEPRFNQIKTVTEPRGNNPLYLPQNGGLSSAGRYTTNSTYDYEEATLGDLNGDGLTSQSHGNVVKLTHPTANAAGTPHSAIAGSANQQVVELFTYNEHGQLLTHTDPAGNVEAREYYPSNGTSLDPADREGYLLRVRKDTGLGTDPNTGQPRLNLTTEYGYDLVGNIVTVTDPRGNTTRTAVNARNLVTSTTSRAPFLYETRHAYDENDMLVLDQTQNVVPIDDVTNQVVVMHSFFNHTYAYDILDRLVEETVDAARPANAPSSSAIATIVTRYSYDKNDNRVLVQRPEAVNETQPNDVESWVYDERNLVATHTRGGVTQQFRTLPAHSRIDVSLVTNSSDTSTSSNAYDANGNLVRLVDGRGNAMRYVYDGFNRQVDSIDPLGNRVATEYDPAGNAVRIQRFGPTGGQGPGESSNPNNAGTNNVLLSESRAQYDELGRKYRTDDRIFDLVTRQALADGPLTPGDGLVTALVEFDKADRVVRTINDNAHEAQTIYDGASRIFRTTDALGNQVEYAYDANGNVVRTVETEVNPENLVPAATFTTIRVYDSLDRLNRTTDPLGFTQRTLYDSRNHAVVSTDARGPLASDALGLYDGSINAPGNAVRSTYDGTGRLLLVSRELRAGGEGSGAIVGYVNTTYEYDADGRLLRVADGNGNPTTYTYDDLGRKTIERFADNTTNQFSYDAEDDLVQLVDASGNVIQNAYDADKRMIQRDVTLAPGFVGTTQQRWEYDGLGRRTLATDDNGAGDDATVLREYDSLGRILRERQNGRLVASAYDGLGNRLRLAYPNGRSVNTTYDDLERINQIAEGGLLADYRYVGPGRVLERELGNGATLRIGYDADRRPTTFNHTTTGGTLIVGFNYTYNRDGDRTTETRWHRDGAGDVYAYDSVHHLVSYKRDSTDPAAELASPGSTTVLRNVTYDLDAVGNRANVTTNGTTTAYVANAVNEYTSVGGESRTHDANGNLVEDATHRFHYDYLNRLRSVERKVDNATVATYAYDAENRRVSKALASGTTAFYYDGWRVVEERDAADATVRQYVYGIYIDEPLVLEVAGSQLYYHGDAQHNVYALTNAAGARIEGYQYNDYGRQTVYVPGADGVVTFGGDDVATEGGVGLLGNPYLFTGRRLDPETGLYHYRVRAYDPDVGRFLQRDPIGAWGDPKALGNAYTYVGNNPMTWVDPLGLESDEPEPAWRWYEFWKKEWWLGGESPVVKESYRRAMKEHDDPDTARHVAALETLGGTAHHWDRIATHTAELYSSLDDLAVSGLTGGMLKGIEPSWLAETTTKILCACGYEITKGSLQGKKAKETLKGAFEKASDIALDEALSEKLGEIRKKHGDKKADAAELTIKTLKAANKIQKIKAQESEDTKKPTSQGGKWGNPVAKSKQKPQKEQGDKK